jgi:hypothetical protein
MSRPRHPRNASALGRAQRAEVLRRLKECRRICDRVSAEQPAQSATGPAPPITPLFDREIQQACAEILKSLFKVAIQRLEQESQ